jgi:predicted thioredoxin/glutaredoxin
MSQSIITDGTFTLRSYRYIKKLIMAVPSVYINGKVYVRSGFKSDKNKKEVEHA